MDYSIESGRLKTVDIKPLCPPLPEKEGDMIIDDELVVTITEIIRNIANMEETDQEIALRIINIVRLYLLRDKRVDNRWEIY